MPTVTAQKQTILPEYVPSDKNLSDIFTKGFHAPRHKELGCALGMVRRANATVSESGN